MTVYLAETLDSTLANTAISKSCSSNIGTSTTAITATAHGLIDGDRVVFTALTGGSGLSTGTIYYVTAATTNTFAVATSRGGTAITMASSITAGTVQRYTAPLGWVEETTVGSAQNVPYFTTVAAPSVLAGNVASWTQNASSKWIAKQFGSAAPSGARIRIRVAMTNVTSTRGAHVLFYNGTTVAFSILWHTDGKVYITNMAGAPAQIAASYSANALQDVTIVLGSAGAISSVTINGSTTSSPGTMNNSVTTVDYVRVDAYNGGSGAGTGYFDAIIADNQTAVPNGSLSASGTLDGVTLGCNRYGQPVIGYTDGASKASAALKVERSADNATWADITAYCTVTATASGFTIVDRRPDRGSQSVANGGTGYYRVTMANGTGNTSALTTGAITLSRNTSAIRSARLAALNTLQDAQASDYFPVNFAATTGEKYVGYWVLAMAYGYYLTGTTSYKTLAVAQFNYISGTVANSDHLLVAPDETTYVYRDFMMRTVYQCALAARFLRAAGESTLAATWIAEIDKWGKAFFDKLNSGAPTSSITKAGWNATNDTTSGEAGITARANSTAYGLGDIVRPSSQNGHTYRCTTAGTSAGSAPTWPTTAGATVTDGTVVWTETTITKPTTAGIYTNNGTTYATASSYDVDMNQIVEEAAAWALLTTDPDSAFSTAGTYKTKAKTRITDVTTLVLAYQASEGRLPIGDPIPPSDGRKMYDSTYGGFSLTTLSVCIAFAPGDCSSLLTTYVDKALNGWFSASPYISEPAAAAHYGDEKAIGLPEIEFRNAAYVLRSISNPLDGLWLTAALNDTTTDKWGYYSEFGNPVPALDAWQARIVQGDALITLLTAVYDTANRGSATATGRAAADKITDTATRGSATATGRTAADVSITTDPASRGSATAAGRNAADNMGGLTDTATRGAATAVGRVAVERTGSFPTWIVGPTSLESAQFGSSTLESAQFGSSTFVVEDMQPIS